HYAFEFFFGHLAVGNYDTRFGNELLHHGSQGIDGLDAIVNEEDLAVASELGFDGGLHQFFLKRGDDRLNGETVARRDRKSTRLNSSHDQISYAVFCLKKKTKIKNKKLLG